MEGLIETDSGYISTSCDLTVTELCDYKGSRPLRGAEVVLRAHIESERMQFVCCVGRCLSQFERPGKPDL